MRIIVSHRADEELHDTADYIRFEFGERAKKKFLQELRHTMRLLSLNPGMGSVEPLLADLPSAYRSIVVNHLSKIVYRITDNHIEISDFWDTRREPKRQAQGLK